MQHDEPVDGVGAAAVVLHCAQVRHERNLSSGHGVPESAELGDGAGGERPDHTLDKLSPLGRVLDTVAVAWRAGALPRDFGLDDRLSEVKSWWARHGL